MERETSAKKKLNTTIEDAVDRSK